MADIVILFVYCYYLWQTLLVDLICLLLLLVADIVILFVYCYYLWQTLMSAVAGWPTVPTRVTTQLEASSVPAPSACCWTVTDRPA